jgi:hypothetical protein
LSGQSGKSSLFAGLCSSLCNPVPPFSFSSKLLAPDYSETYYNSSGNKVTTSPQIMV